MYVCCVVIHFMVCTSLQITDNNKKSWFNRSDVYKYLQFKVANSCKQACIIRPLSSFALSLSAEWHLALQWLHCSGYIAVVQCWLGSGLLLLLGEVCLHEAESSDVEWQAREPVYGAVVIFL